MGELAPISVIPGEEFESRTESGLLVPMAAGQGLRVVDCGDVRPLTPESATARARTHGGETVPGRYFGGISGLTLTVLTALAAQSGEAFMAQFVNEYSPEAFVDFAVDLSHRAHMQNRGLELNQHSASTNEGNQVAIASADERGDTPLGCAFAALAGKVLHMATDRRALEGARRVDAAAGHESPLDAALEGAKILSKHLPHEFAISRQALHHAIAEQHRHAPYTILEGRPIPATETAVVIDLAGYRASADRHLKAGIPRYHHTPGIASSLIPELLPEHKLDPELLLASGSLLGLATRDALSGESTPADLRVEVIPPDYAKAA